MLPRGSCRLFKTDEFSNFQTYNVPRAPPFSRKEDKQVSYFLLFREQCHDSPLYTQARTWNDSYSKGRRAYGQDQINKRYGQKSKATVDPFLAVPTYSKRFAQAERALPDLESWPFAKEFFPEELHATLEGEGGPAQKRRRTGPKTLALSSITFLRTAEELFLGEGHQIDAAGNISRAIQEIDSLEKRAGEDEGFLSGDEDDWVKDKDDEDGEGNADDPDRYESESDDDNDDYNAEAYFDGNQDDEDYGDDGGDDGGDYM